MSNGGRELLCHLRKATQCNGGRQLLCHLRKKGTQCNGGHAYSFSRHSNFFIDSSAATTPAIFSKLPYAHIAQIFRGKAAEQASALSNRGPFIAQRVVLFKDLNAYIRRAFNSYYNRFSGFRRYPGSSNFLSPQSMVLSLVGVNVAVSLLWRQADRRFMEKNFKISMDNFLDGRVHTLITSAFSHIRLEHLLSNMIGLYFFGSSIGRLFGAEYLLKLYLAGAVVGSICFLVNEAFIVPWRKGIPQKYYNPRYTPGGLGASGAVNAIILLDIFLFPKAVHYLNFFIPVPAILLGAFFIGQDLWRVKQGDTHVSGAAHLGGALVAVFAWARIKRFI